MSITLPPASGGVADSSPPPVDDDGKGLSLWRGAFRRLRRNPSAIVGLLIVLAFVVVAIIAPLLTPYEPGSAQWSGEVTPTSVPGPS
jgi:peptide/nickel transport system permease protein